MVLLNRRGYAPLMYCLDCGKTVTCPNCGIGLAFHKARARSWFATTAAMPRPTLRPCPECGSPQFSATGEGTEKSLPSSWASLRASLFCAWIATIHVALARSRKFSKILQPRNRLFLLARKCFRRGTIFPRNPGYCGRWRSWPESSGLQASESDIPASAPGSRAGGTRRKPGRVLIQTPRPKSLLLEVSSGKRL